MKNTLLVIIFTLSLVSITIAQDWHTNYQEAQEQAEIGDKKLILVFQGSDWCVPCMKLEREILNTDIFKAYSQEHFIMLKADFPRKKKNALSEEQAQANAKLAESYNHQGVFPLVVVMDSQGKVLGEMSYKKVSPEAYIQLLNELRG